MTTVFLSVSQDLRLTEETEGSKLRLSLEDIWPGLEKIEIWAEFRPGRGSATEKAGILFREQRGWRNRQQRPWHLGDLVPTPETPVERAGSRERARKL